MEGANISRHVEYLAFGERVALQAGSTMQAERLRTRIWQNPDGSWTSRADQLINEMVIDEINSHFKGHAVRGEERSYGDPDAEHVWWVDPIEGTGEYINTGLTENLTYGFSLAKMYRGGLEVALYFAPTRSELFTAAAGLGSYINGVRMQVGTQTLQPGVPYDYDPWEGSYPNTHIFEDLFGPPRGDYATTYQACMVARGESAFCIYPGTAGHDIRPGELITIESEGRVTDVYGGSTLSGAVFSNGVVHEQVLDIIRQLPKASH